MCVSLCVGLEVVARESASLSCSSSCTKCDRCAQLDLTAPLLGRAHCVVRTCRDGSESN